MGSLSLLQGNLPNPGIEPMSPSMQADSLPAELPGKPWPAHLMPWPLSQCLWVLLPPPGPDLLPVSRVPTPSSNPHQPSTSPGPHWPHDRSPDPASCPLSFSGSPSQPLTLPLSCSPPAAQPARRCLHKARFYSPTDLNFNTSSSKRSYSDSPVPSPSHFTVTAPCTFSS